MSYTCDECDTIFHNHKNCPRCGPSGVVDPNPKKAYGDKKAPVHLVPPALLLETSWAMKEGADKYGPYNWRSSKVESMTYIGAIARHLACYLDGEDVDPESPTGKMHLAGITGCCAILLDATRGGFLIDNRPPNGPGAEMSREKR